MTCTTSGCCCDIHTCHTELVHAQAEIQQTLIEFTAADWRGKNFLEVVQYGTPGPNQIGPHYLPKRTYSVAVYRKTGEGSFRIVEVNTLVDVTTGVITVWKSSSVRAFSGRIEVR